MTMTDRSWDDVRARLGLRDGDYDQARASRCHENDTCVMDAACPFRATCMTAQADG